MTGDTHCLVANLALACLSQKERHILYPRWGGIEAGATLSDHFRIMWEPIEPGGDKQLVHRCWIDSDNIKNHGCVTRALDHSEGSLSFINAYLKGELEGAYSEDEFLENLGMYLGVASHHIADLCTPVHVGHKLDFASLGFKSLARLHGRVERDIAKRADSSQVGLRKPQTVEFSPDYFMAIARETYDQSFVSLEAIYANDALDGLEEMASRAISSAVGHTADVWHTILESTGMTNKEWSMQPLL
jgi:hypothetical protein